jgi:hypothetical protein
MNSKSLAAPQWPTNKAAPPSNPLNSSATIPPSAHALISTPAAFVGSQPYYSGSMRRLSVDCGCGHHPGLIANDDLIAGILNRNGLRTGYGNR